MVDFYPLPLFDSNFEMIFSPGQKVCCLRFDFLDVKIHCSPPHIIASNYEPYFGCNCDLNFMDHSTEDNQNFSFVTERFNFCFSGLTFTL